MQFKKRYPRVEREVPVDVHEDENAHLWAISYSDFLMALLSFFILFFSMDDKKQSQLILTLADDFSQMGGAKEDGAGKGTSGALASKDVETQKALPQGLDEVLKDLNVQMNKEEETLRIDFPADFFANGKYQINGSQNELMKKVLAKIKPYQNGIKLYFEGHTDSKPSQTKVNDIVIDNFLLSSLRASNALFKAREMGFDEKHMYIQAVSSNLRNTRSLSLRIVPLHAEGI